MPQYEHADRQKISRCGSASARCRANSAIAICRARAQPSPEMLAKKVFEMCGNIRGMTRWPFMARRPREKQGRRARFIGSPLSPCSQLHRRRGHESSPTPQAQNCHWPDLGAATLAGSRHAFYGQGLMSRISRAMSFKTLSRRVQQRNGAYFLRLPRNILQRAATLDTKDGQMPTMNSHRWSPASTYLSPHRTTYRQCGSLQSNRLYWSLSITNTRHIPIR